jgi:hypothetical protein
LAENLDKSIGYGNYLAEKLDQTVGYAEHIAENADNAIQYTNYIAEQADSAIQYTNYIAEHADSAIQYTNYIAEHADNLIKYSEYIAENAATKKDFKNLTEYAEYMFENMGADFGSSAKENISEDREAQIKKSILDGAIKESEDVTVRYSSLDEKIESVLESIRKQKVEERNEDRQYPFIKFLSESKREEFFALGEADKARVKNALNQNPSFNEERIVAVWENALSASSNEKWLSDMPAEYLPMWESATPEIKDRINRQAKLFRLDNAYQINNFWQTRTELKNVAAAPLNESEKVESKPAELGYDKAYLESIKEGLARFNR